MFDKGARIGYKSVFQGVAAQMTANKEFCQSCKQKDNCEEIYGKLAEAEGPSVTSRVVVAFLGPLVVFVVCLAVFEKIAGVVANSEGLRGVVALVSAVVVTFLWVLSSREIMRRFGGKR